MSNPNTRGRPWLWGVGLLVVGLLSATGWWLKGRATRPPPPPPRWTLDDLPAPPPAAENGWARLRSAGAVHHLSRKAMAFVPPDRELGPDDDLSVLVEAGVAAELKPDAALRLEVARLARFADDTEPLYAFGGEGPTQSALALWRQRALAALLGAQQEQMGEAWIDAERMWRQAYDLAVTCRSQLSCRVALMMLANGLGTIEILAGHSGPDHRGRLAAAARLLDGTDLQSVTLRHALVAEQLGLREFQQPRDYEARRELAVFDDFTAAAITYAEDPARPKPSFPPHAVGDDWWPFDDDEEAQMLQGLADLMTMKIDHHRAERDELIRSRDHLVAQLRGASEGAGGAAGDE